MSERDFENDIDSELDLPPEYCHYSDEGCELSPSCLDCPFPHCLREEEADGGLSWLNRYRKGRVARLSRKGMSASHIASMLGVTLRTVKRARRAANRRRRTEEDGSQKGRHEVEGSRLNHGNSKIEEHVDSRSTIQDHVNDRQEG